MSGPLPLSPSAETTSFSETSESSSPEEMVEQIVVSKEKKDKFYKPKKAKRTQIIE